MEKCLACGNPPDYCLGGHGEPCEHCVGWCGEGDSSGWHDISCVIEENNETKWSSIISDGFVIERLGSDDWIYSIGEDGLRAVDYPANVYLAMPGEGAQGSLKRIADERDKYPDYRTNGNHGWDVC